MKNMSPWFQQKQYSRLFGHLHEILIRPISLRLNEPALQRVHSPRCTCAAAAYMLLCACIGAAQPFAWQTENEGPRPRSSQIHGSLGGWELDSPEVFKGMKMPQVAGGMGMNVRVRPDAPPLVLGPLPIGSGHDAAKALRHRGKFGGIGVGNAPAMQAGEGEPRWACFTLPYEAQNGDEPFNLHVTRLAPALLVDTPGVTLSFFMGMEAFNPAAPDAPGKDPASGVMLAWPDKDKVGVAPAADYPELSKDARWLLVWFGEASPEAPLDCPMLLLFNAPPALVEADGGLLVTAAGDADEFRAALLPLRGEMRPAISETAAWKDGLPEDVERDCRWWAEHLRSVPLSVYETYEYEEETDTVSVTETFSDFFDLVSSGGQRLLPVPATLAMAIEEGFPVEISGEVVKSPAVTLFGPYRLAAAEGDSYTWSIKGLGRYALQRPAFKGNVPDGNASELRALLVEEVLKMLAAGHLAPWYMPRSGQNDGWTNLKRFIYSNPGDTLSALCLAMPHLPEEMQSKVKEYLKQERESYPPETIAHLPSVEGEVREGYMRDTETAARFPTPVPATNFTYFGVSGDKPNLQSYYPELKLIENAYAMAEYAHWAEPEDAKRCFDAVRAMFGPYLRRSDWATMGFFRLDKLYDTLSGLDKHYAWYGQAPEAVYGWGGVADANQQWVAALGLVRLARMAGRTDAEQEAWGLLARASVFRFALGKWVGWLYRTGRRSAEDRRAGEPARIGNFVVIWDGPQSDPTQVSALNEQGALILRSHGGNAMQAHLNAFTFITPELGGFLGDFLEPECRAFMKAMEITHPTWHLALAAQRIGGSEIGMAQPMDGRQLFMLRAWALKEAPDYLTRFIDLPYVERGDLYYIERLASTLAAYRGVEWR